MNKITDTDAGADTDKEMWIKREMTVSQFQESQKNTMFYEGFDGTLLQQLPYLTLGMVGEVSELLEAIYGLEEMVQQEELGDFLWYFYRTCELFDVIPADKFLESSINYDVHTLIVLVGRYADTIKKILRVSLSLQQKELEKRREALKNYLIAAGVIVYRITQREGWSLNRIRFENQAKLAMRYPERYPKFASFLSNGTIK